MHRFLKTAAVAIFGPLVAYSAAAWALDRFPSGGSGVFEAGYFASGVGGQIARLETLQDVALVAAVASVVVLTLFFVLGRLAGESRALNALIFPTTMSLTTALISILLLVQGAAMSVSAVLGDFDMLILTLVVGLLGLGALLGGALMVISLWRMTKPRPQELIAHQIKRREAEPLWRFVDDVAAKIDARPPDHIVVGLMPNFFATAAPLTTPDSEGVLRGETLYISAPLTRLFTDDELRAVIAHELGHFSGEDTAYSLRFAPVYRRIATALHALRNEEGELRHLGSAPADALLRYLLETFGRNERAISRLREFEADRIGVAASSADALGLSLAKVAVYAALWEKVRRDNVERLNAGKISRNLSRVYADSARFDVGNQLIDKILNAVLEAQISHPTDSHPALAERYRAIGFEPGALTIETLTRQGEVGCGLFPSLEDVEEALTLLEHNVMIMVGAAKAPVENAEHGKLVRLAYVLAAKMVTADGAVLNREIGVAEMIGARLFEAFDPVSFREIVAQIDETPPFRQVVDLLASHLNDEDKRVLHAYLGEIADSDAEVGREETALLDYVTATWRIREPLWRRMAPFAQRSRDA